MDRIRFLDGLRGIAILLVVFFHAFARWPKIVPYSNKFSFLPVFKFGYFGVQLFFLISGFVILMSLEKNENFKQFIYKRWLRLFPSMLIATILIFITSRFFYERPLGMPQISSVLPGLMFVEPNWIALITGFTINPLEGSFWSLYIEFKFYIIFGILYFAFGKIKAILGIFLMFILSIIAGKSGIQFLCVFSNLFSFQYFGWFASGSLAYLYFENKQIKYLVLSIFVAILEMYKYKNNLEQFLFVIFILGIFIIPIYFEKIRFIFNNRLFLFYGLISYPLYLIHENIMISLICKINKAESTISYSILPLFPIVILSCVSYFIVNNLEPFVRNKIKTFLILF